MVRGKAGLLLLDLCEVLDLGALVVELHDLVLLLGVVERKVLLRGAKPHVQGGERDFAAVVVGHVNDVAHVLLLGKALQNVDFAHESELRLCEGVLRVEELGVRVVELHPAQLLLQLLILNHALDRSVLFREGMGHRSGH